MKLKIKIKFFVYPAYIECFHPETRYRNLFLYIFYISMADLKSFENKKRFISDIITCFSFIGLFVNYRKKKYCNTNTFFN